MTMLERLKHTYGNLQLRRESIQVSRIRKDPDFHRAKKVAVLYNATERENFAMVREFIKDLRECGKSPVSLGYIDFKEVTFHALARPEADYFFKHQLNWFQKPGGPVVDNFIGEDFDILINLTLQDCYPIDYVAAVSKAGLKIGRAGSAVAFCYDMTFALGPDADLHSFAYLIIHYLNNINVHSTQRNRSSHHHSV